MDVTEGEKEEKDAAAAGDPPVRLCTHYPLVQSNELPLASIKSFIFDLIYYICIFVVVLSVTFLLFYLYLCCCFISDIESCISFIDSGICS